MPKEFRTFKAASSGQRCTPAPTQSVRVATVPSPSSDTLANALREGVKPAVLPPPSPIGPAPKGK
jgi:hypothetical protein